MTAVREFLKKKLIERIDQLPLRERIALSLRYSDGLKISEIALVLRVDVQEALRLVKIARAKILYPAPGRSS